MADDHEVAQLAEHRPRDLAREGARVLVVQVLRCQGDACAPQQPANGLQSDERRADDRFHALDLFQARKHRRHEPARLGGGHVHLPVAGDDGASHPADLT